MPSAAAPAASSSSTARAPPRPRAAHCALGACWGGAPRPSEAGIYRATAILRVSPRGLKLLRELSAAVAEAAARTAEAPDADGWSRLVIPIESIDHAAQELIKLGAEAEVLAPVSLRARIGEAASRLAALYANSAELENKPGSEGSVAHSLTFHLS